MRLKAVLRSLLLAYGLTGLLLLLLAFVLFRFEPGEGTAAAGITFYLCGILSDGRVCSRQDHEERPISLGNHYGTFLLCITAYCFFHGTREMGYDFCPCSDYFLYVSGGWSTWGNAVIKACKKNALKISNFMLY